MLFKDFNEAILLVRRFLNPELMEKLKNSTKEEDKIEYEKSSMYNKLITKVMPAAMIKVFQEKGESILDGDSSTKDAFDMSCVYFGDLLGFTFALNNVTNMAKDKFKVDSYGSISRRIESFFLIRLTRETWQFSDRINTIFDRIGRILLKPAYIDNNLLIKVKNNENDDPIFANDKVNNSAMSAKYMAVKHDFDKMKTVFHKILYILNNYTIKGLDGVIDNIWGWIDNAAVNNGIMDMKDMNSSAAELPIKISDKSIKGLIIVNFDIVYNDTKMALYRAEKDLMPDGQYR